ncbi:hypothetical protein ACDQ55_02870 [Chitinophaga sp. 30R24]|uniref:hypothetical protein n=1 Tax=Chitinophaga sp. 30R24 TaxID=3248838 RepID=UPI003B90E4E8
MNKSHQLSTNIFYDPMSRIIEHRRDNGKPPLFEPIRLMPMENQLFEMLHERYREELSQEEIMKALWRKIKRGSLRDLVCKLNRKLKKTDYLKVYTVRAKTCRLDRMVQR